MSFAIGYLIGTVLLLILVLYITRIRSPPVPAAPVEDENAAKEIMPELQACELCERKRVCEDVKGLLVCGECQDDLL